MLDFSSLDMKLNPSYLVLVFKTRNRCYYHILIRILMLKNKSWRRNYFCHTIQG